MSIEDVVLPISFIFQTFQTLLSPTLHLYLVVLLRTITTSRLCLVGQLLPWLHNQLLFVLDTHGLPADIGCLYLGLLQILCDVGGYLSVASQQAVH